MRGRFTMKVFQSGRISAIHVLVVVLSMALTLGAWHYSKTQAENRIEQRFEAARDHIVRLIQDRMSKYEDALWAGVAAMESHDNNMSLEQWRIFAANMRIDQKYPGINGIGVIHFLTDDTVAPYLRERLEERPEFEIFPPHEQSVYMPISFIEPEAENAAAVGLDVAHELNRRMGALASRDTGEARITGPIVLVQDAGATPGFLFYAPFFTASDAETVSQRRETIVGVVYAPFVVRSLLDGLLAKELRHATISISDTGQTIYDEHDPNETLYDPNPMFTQQVQLNFYGRSWTLDIRSNVLFRENNTYIQPTVIMIGGIMIEILVVALMLMMANANRAAVRYADAVTAELRSEQQKLVRTNAELEQFAYAASHDLKTPIRGIGGLVDMLREDLQDFLSKQEVGEAVSVSLDLIEDRVERMNDLTNGIIEFARIDPNYEKCRPLDLSELSRSLATDFDLQPDQIVLKSDINTISVDPIGLRRVIENLVGNAVKYHDQVGNLVVTVSCTDAPGSLQFSVSDNGPGIAPQYQQRIFEMFQTLRAGDAPESTGIGLAIVRKTVEVHGGLVRVISNCGEGATFYFEWPRSKEDMSAMEREIAA